MCNQGKDRSIKPFSLGPARGVVVKGMWPQFGAVSDELCSDLDSCSIARLDLRKERKAKAKGMVA